MRLTQDRHLNDSLSHPHSGVLILLFVYSNTYIITQFVMNDKSVTLYKKVLFVKIS